MKGFFSSLSQQFGIVFCTEGSGTTSLTTEFMFNILNIII